MEKGAQKKKETEESSEGEFKRLLAISKSYAKTMTVSQYCDIDLDEICVEGKASDTECLALKIVVGFQQIWKCAGYTWDTSTRKNFYKNVARLFRAAESFNRRMAEHSEREALISEATMEKIVNLYNTITFENLHVLKKERDILRREERVVQKKGAKK